MTTSVSTTQPTYLTQPTTTTINERVKKCMISTYLEQSDYKAVKLNDELNYARRTLSFYNRENKTKILMLALVIIMVGGMCLVTVFFFRRR